MLVGCLYDCARFDDMADFFGSLVDSLPEPQQVKRLLDLFAFKSDWQ